MSERVLEFSNTVIDRRGRAYGVSVEGELRRDGLWEGRVRFTPVETGEAISTERETLQSDFNDLQYWASGLTAAYLEGALERAQDGHRLASRGEWRSDQHWNARRSFEVCCADDMVPAELLGTFALRPGVSRDLPDGSRITYAGTAYRGADGSERAHTFELNCASDEAQAEQWVRERLDSRGMEPRFER